VIETGVEVVRIRRELERRGSDQRAREAKAYLKSDLEFLGVDAGGIRATAREVFIRKAIGWVLRDASKKRPELVYGFLADHIDRVSGLTLREGAKHLPKSQREALLAHFRTGQ
jgi:hypothetical protein